jgi:hypothetical protein
MPSPKAQPQATQFPVNEIGAKALDAVSVIAEANQRVIGQLLDLSSSTAADRLRTLGELHAAAAEATRGIWAPVNPREAFEEFRQDPVAWYRKGFLSALDGTQQMVKLFETSAQIVARDTERFQGAAERTGKAIQDAVGGCASRLRELYTTAG